MKTNLSLSLDTRRQKKDGTFPIILRLSHGRKTTSISMGYSIHERNWDYKNRKIRRSYKGVTSINRLNNILAKEKTEAMDIINKLQDKKRLNHMGIMQLKTLIANKSKYESFFEFGNLLMIQMKEMNRFGNAQSYYHILRAVKRFTKGRDLKFNEINYEFLINFEKEHLSRKCNSINGVASYMKGIRAIYNKAIKMGFADKDSHPFEYYTIRTTPTRKRALDLKHIHSILKLELEPTHRLFDYRNYFIISYMLYGISFIDLAYLRMDNIIDGRIKFKRRKTGKLYDIKIFPQLEKMLCYYVTDKTKKDYLFDIIKRENPEEAYKDATWERLRYNKGLKEIGNLCNIDTRLTSYVSRHSFATQAMLHEIPLVAISAMLGHSKLSTTQIYLKELPNNVLDSYNERIHSL
jgi:integrase/recombinase XerD